MSVRSQLGGSTRNVSATCSPCAPQHATDDSSKSDATCMPLPRLQPRTSRHAGPYWCCARSNAYVLDLGSRTLAYRTELKQQIPEAALNTCLSVGPNDLVQCQPCGVVFTLVQHASFNSNPHLACALLRSEASILSTNRLK